MMRAEQLKQDWNSTECPPSTTPSVTLSLRWEGGSFVKKTRERYAPGGAKDVFERRLVTRFGRLSVCLYVFLSLSLSLTHTHQPRENKVSIDNVLADIHSGAREQTQEQKRNRQMRTRQEAHHQSVCPQGRIVLFTALKESDKRRFPA